MRSFAGSARSARATCCARLSVGRVSVSGRRSARANGAVQSVRRADVADPHELQYQLSQQRRDREAERRVENMCATLR